MDVVLSEQLIGALCGAVCSVLFGVAFLLQGDGPT